MKSVPVSCRADRPLATTKKASNTNTYSKLEEIVVKLLYLQN